MRFGVAVPSQGAFANRAAVHDIVMAAEELGFDSAWFSDHIAVPAYASHVTSPRWLDALACCMLGAGWTERLRFGTDVLVLPYRHPLVVAKLVASADELCGGRLTLGVGVGYVRGEFDALNAPPYDERGAVMTEYLEVLRTAWCATGAVSHDGRHVSFHDVHLGPGPAQDPLPVWVGGNGLAARRRSALHGDGWHPLFPAPDEYRAARRDIESQRVGAGRVGAFTYSLSTAHVQVVLDGEATPMRSSPRKAPPQEYDYKPPFSVTATGRPYLVGNPDELRDDLDDYRAAGVDHMVLRFWTPDSRAVQPLIDQMQRWAEQIGPGGNDHGSASLDAHHQGEA